MSIINRKLSVTRSLSETTETRFNNDEANSIIDQLIKESLRESHRQRISTDQKLLVQWPTIGEFTSDRIGSEKIIEYIEKDWKAPENAHDPAWVFGVDFLERKSFESNDLFIYRVRYSMPTRRVPIPRHSISVYFTIDVSKVEPKETPVKVSFIFETTRSICYPENFQFRPNWLENIDRMKKILARDLDF